MRNSKISVQEAASIIGKANLFVREGMKRGVLEIGVAMQMPGRERWTFSISPSMLAQYLGISVEELYKRVEEIREKKGVAV